MKKLSIVLLALLLLLAACDGAEDAVNELKENDTDKAEAKVNAEKKEKTDEESDDIWTYYNDAKWSDEFNGLKVEIQKVVVSDKAPTPSDADAEESAVGVKFRVENTSDKVITAYPDQAVLVTSTGEQIEMPEPWVSDNIGGDIHEGVIKEGDVIWYLERGHAKDIEWIKLEFDAYDDESDDSRTFTAELKLKE